MIELFRCAESRDTAVEVSVASGFRVFQIGVRRLSVTAQLLGQAHGNPKYQRMIAARIAALVEQQIDLRYLHPHDIPLAIYLWVLHRLDEHLARTAAIVVLHARNCSWARSMAERILTDEESAADTGIRDVHSPGASSTGTPESHELRIPVAGLPALESLASGRWSFIYSSNRVGSHVDRKLAFGFARSDTGSTRVAPAA